MSIPFKLLSICSFRTVLININKEIMLTPNDNSIMLRTELIGLLKIFFKLSLKILIAQGTF